MRYLIAFLCASVAWGGTVVTDTIKTPFTGVNFSGIIEITAPVLTLPDDSTAGGWKRTIQVRGGYVSIELEPTDTATPAGSRYTFKFTPLSGVSWTRYANVPTSVSAVKLSDILEVAAPSPTQTVAISQLSPTSAAKGDLIAFGTAWGRLNVGTNGYVLTADSTQSSGVKWAAQTGGVTSVFGRTGVVTADADDYAAHYAAIAHVHLISSITGLQDALDAKSGISHTHAGVYEPVDLTLIRTSGSYADPAWITSLHWDKLASVPSTFAPSTHASSHQNGGADEIATATPGASAIPKAGAGGTLGIGWLATGTPDGTKFVRDDGTLAVPASGGGLPSGGTVGQYVVNTGSGTGTWGSQSAGSGVVKTVVGNNVTWSTDSAVLGFLALDNAWLGNHAFAGKLFEVPFAAQTLTVSDAIVASAGTVQITAAGTITSTAAPTIADGSQDGQRITLVNVGANTITLQDEANLASSNLCLSGDANQDIAGSAAMLLVWNATASCWIQASTAGNSGVVSYYQTVQEEGGDLAQRGKLNITGAGVTCTDDSGNDRTTCAISEAGGAAPSDAQYLTLATDGDLTVERVLTPGAMISGTDAGANGAYTLAFNPLDTGTAFWRDEFGGGGTTAGTLGTLNWWAAAIAGTCAYANSNNALSANNPGYLRIVTGGTSGNGCVVSLGSTIGSSSSGMAVLNNRTFDFTWVVKLEQATTVKAAIGLVYDAAVLPSDGLFFKVDLPTSANFIAVVMNGSTPVAFDTGIAVNTVFHKFRIRCLVAGTILISIDGGTERSFCASGCDETATIPTTPLTPAVAVVTDTTGTRSLQFDFFAGQMAVTR